MLLVITYNILTTHTLYYYLPELVMVSTAFALLFFVTKAFIDAIAPLSAELLFKLQI